jgi:hypothetical protein
MPRKKRLPLEALPDVKQELLAQELADGRSPAVAYLALLHPDMAVEERERIAQKDRNEGDPGHATKLRGAAGAACRKQEVRDRVNGILAERHDKRMAVKMEDVKISTAYVTDRLTSLVDRCMQTVPVKNGQGNAVGVYKFEPMAACKALELLGLEQGMFERTHKHLHAKQNPLDGSRDQIVGRLGVLLDQLSDADLFSLGLQRLDVIEVRSERVDDVGGQQGTTIQAVRKAS